MTGAVRARNLIVCCDGTGNRGGVTPDTNVYRIFNAIERRDAEVEQLAYYDDGVGTEHNKYLSAFGGAMGWGFSKNVEDAYCFLCRNFRQGDRIYLFGFSRGAYTVRALAALIISAGIVPANGLSEPELKDKTRQLRLAYGRFQAARRFQEALRLREGLYRYWYRLRCQSWVPARYRYDRVGEENLTFEMFWKEETGGARQSLPQAQVQFLGVWDTVSALGLPFDIGLKRIFEGWINRYRFVDNYLSDRVLMGRHALSLDDQRRTFFPEVWNEWKLLACPNPPLENEENQIDQDSAHRAKEQRAVYFRCTNVDQAWFSGVHSNVGGGYPKHGPDYVALEWMVRDLESVHGLRFKKPFCDEIARHADVHGRLYDSRSGLAAYYRYSPRRLRKAHGFYRLRPRAPGEPNASVDLERPTVQPSVQMHESVLWRIDCRTDGYNPGNLPADIPIVVVDSRPLAENSRLSAYNERLAQSRQERVKLQVEAERWFHRREMLHLAFVMMTLLGVVSLLHVGVRPRGLAIPDGPLEATFYSWAGTTRWFAHYVIPLSLVGILVWVAHEVSGLLKVVPLFAALLSLVAVSFPIDFLEPIDALHEGVAWLLEFLLPDMVADSLQQVVALHRGPFLIACVAVGYLFYLRGKFREESEACYERMNALFRKQRASSDGARGSGE